MQFPMMQDTLTIFFIEEKEGDIFVCLACKWFYEVEECFISYLFLLHFLLFLLNYSHFHHLLSFILFCSILIYIAFESFSFILYYFIFIYYIILYYIILYYIIFFLSDRDLLTKSGRNCYQRWHSYNSRK